MRPPRPSHAPRRSTGRPVLVRLGLGPLLCAALAGAAAARASAEPIAVHGLVEDDAGRPLSGATARLYPALGAARAAGLQLDGAYPPPAVAEARSGAAGRFRLAAPGAGHWRVVVSAPGRAERQATLRPLVEETWLRPLELPAEAPLEVRVTGPGGAPVAGAHVVASPGLSRGWFPGGWEAPIARVRTGADGRAVVPRGAADRLDVAGAAVGFALIDRKGISGSSLALELRTGPRRAILVHGSDGQPAADVLVMDVERMLPLGRTGPGGRLLLTLAEGRPLRLQLEGAAGATARAVVEPLAAGAEPAPVEVRLAPPLAVSGRVIDAERRRPVAGALVWLPGEVGEAATTDGQGGYRLLRPASADGTVRLGAAAAGYFPTDAQLREGVATAPTLALAPAGSLVGSVTDPAGRPLGEVEVSAAPLERGMGMMRAPRFGAVAPRATSDAQGRFRLGGLDPRSRHAISFRRDGYAPLRREVGVPPDRPGQLDVALAAGAVAQGSVVDERGAPVSGAELSLRRQEDSGEGDMRVRFGGEETEEADAETGSDGSGRFRFTDLAPGRYVLSASASGFATATLPATEVPEGVSPVDLGRVVLAPGVRVIGRVVDGRGAPLAGADVFALSSEEAAIPMLRWILEGREADTTTGADGAFVLADRGAGERVTVAARRAGTTPASAAGVVAPNEEPVVLVLRQASAVRGRVVDPRGEPVRAARVSLSIERSGGGMMLRGTAGSTVTAEDGRFELADVEPGMVRVMVNAEGFLELSRSGVEVPAGRDLEGLELVLQQGAVVEGVVTTPDGSPAIGARVGVAAEGSTGPMARMTFSGGAADGDGRYRLSGIEPGRRTITAELDGFERGVAELEVAPGENRLDLRLGAGQQVGGRVVGAGGEPLAGATVRLVVAGEMWWSRHGATTDEAGVFTIQGVPDGTYEAIASHSDHAEGRVPVEVAGAPVEGLLLELAAGGTVAGALRGLEPAELARVQVHASADGVWRQGEVGRDGRYRIAGLRAGHWRVSAEVEGSGRQARGSVELAAGQAEATLDLDFTGGFAVHGVVRHEGRAVDGAMVIVFGEDVSGMARGSTDYQGRYRLENLAAGSYRLEVADLVRGLRHRAALTLEGDRELDVDLRAARIAGRVLEATSEEPVVGARLELEPLDEEPERFRFLGRAESDDRGVFVLGSVGDGRWRLVAEKEGYAPAETVLELAGEPVDGVELRLQPTQGIVLAVARTVGSPPADVAVAVLDGAGRIVTGGTYPTSETGTVRVSTAPAGSWEVLVRAAGTGTARVPALSPGPAVPVLLSPGATLEVVVPELAGDEGIATVVLRGGDGRPFLFFPWPGEVRAEAQMARGRTLLHHLAAGDWTVEVTARDGRRWSARATASPGAATTVELE